MRKRDVGMILVLLTAMVLLLSACVPWGNNPGPVPGGAFLRMARPSVRVVSFASTGIGGQPMRIDSLDVMGNWTLPVVTDQYGPIDGMQVCALGGSSGFILALSPQNSRCVNFPGNVTSATIRLPFDLSGGAAPSGATDQWVARMCVTPSRRGIPGPQVCAESVFTVVYPAPPGVVGLTVQAVIRSFP